MLYNPDYFNIKKAFNRTGAALLALVMASQLAGGILGVAAMWLSDEENMLFSVVLASFIGIYVIALPVFLYIMKKVPNFIRDPSGYKAVSLKQLSGVLLAGFGISYATSYLTKVTSYGLGSIFDFSSTDNLFENIDLSYEFSDYLPLLIYAVLIAPIAEELLFRRFLYKKLVGYGGKAYILFSAVSFGLFHMNLGQIFYAAFLGAILALVMYHTGKTIYCIILHMVFNFIGSFIPLLTTFYGGDFSIYLWNALTLVFTLAGLVLAVKWYKNYSRHRRTARIKQFFYAGDAQAYCAPHQANAYAAIAYEKAASKTFGILKYCRVQLDEYGRQYFAYDSELDCPEEKPSFYPEIEPSPGEKTVRDVKLILFTPTMTAFIIIAFASSMLSFFSTALFGIF